MRDGSGGIPRHSARALADGMPMAGHPSSDCLASPRRNPGLQCGRLLAAHGRGRGRRGRWHFGENALFLDGERRRGEDLGYPAAPKVIAAAAAAPIHVLLMTPYSSFSSEDKQSVHMTVPSARVLVSSYFCSSLLPDRGRRVIFPQSLSRRARLESQISRRADGVCARRPNALTGRNSSSSDGRTGRFAAAPRRVAARLLHRRRQAHPRRSRRHGTCFRICAGVSTPCARVVN